MIFRFLILTLALFSTSQVWARGGGGGHSLGGGLVIGGPTQSDLDSLVDYADTNVAGGVSTKNFGSATELFAFYQYRFSGTMFAFQFRPSFFSQSVSGSGTGGDYDYSLTGFTVFPMFRMYPLENDFIRFFLQTGIGYGRLSGKVEEGAGELEFSGGNFGALFGLGAEFCFTDNHCAAIEGNYRYLPIERNIVTKSNGGSFAGSITGSTKDEEFEMNNRDVKTFLSGFSGYLLYTYHF